MNRIYYVLILLCLISCKKETKGFDEKNLLKPVDFGEYHTIGQSGLKVFLPEGFKKISLEKRQDFINSIEGEEAKDYIKSLYKARENTDFTFYDFYNEDLSSEVVVSTMPYTPFGKRTAIQLLTVIRKNNDQYEEITDIVHEKVKSTYFGDKGLQIFKAIYKLYAFDKYSGNYEEILYKTIYIISSKKKTFSITVTTPYELDFAPFIKKTKL